jgi:tetratricopeptide (TPR) repeat protein
MADNYRYPGPSSFSFEQRSVFFGRDEDISNMRTSVIVNPTTVLFGKSGTGKSSLIQAGLLPKLLDATEKNSKVSPYLIIDVMPKPFEKGKNLWEEVKNIISKKIEPDHEFLKITGLQNSSSLWYLLKGLQYTHYIKKINQTVLLIFDQCEELFTYPDSQIDKFVQELYPVIGQFIPEQFQKIISTQKTSLSTDELKVLYEPLIIKFLFSIRSDKLHLITRLKKASPNILQNSYELLPLTKQSAFEAIDKPSQADGDFTSKEKFTVTNDAKEYIFKELSAQQNEPEDYFEEARIDPFSLQIICQYIERNIVPETTVVTEYFGFPEEIIKGYYLSSINKLRGSDDEKVKVKNFIELRLLQNNRRIPIHEDLITADEKYPVSKEILSELVDFRILKKDISVSGGLMYEITHDCFIAPINEAKEERLGKTYEYKSSETINDLLKQIQQKESSATIIRSAAGAQEANEKQQAGIMNLASSADSNLSDLYKKLGDAYVVVQDYRQAIDAFTKAIDSEISNRNNTSLIEVYRARANAYYSILDFINSDKDLEKIVQINPDDYLAIYTLAQNKRDEKNYDESTGYYEKAIELNPSNIGIYNDIGNNYYYDKNYEKAKEYYQKTVDKNPDADYAWYNLGLVEETLMNTEEALKYYGTALKLNPSSNTFNTIGNIYFGIKDYDNAQHNYEEALKLDNTFFYATYNIGLIEENRGNLDSAVSYYNKALEINPTYENAFIGLANANYKKGDFEAAKRNYLKLIELYPEQAGYYYELAGIEQSLKDWNAVIDNYKKVMELDPTYKNDIANNDTGLAYFNMQDWENAEKYFMKALEIQPGNYLYLNNVSAVKLNLGDFEGAEEYVKKSIEVKPDYALSYYNYGNIYESRDNPTEAIAYYKKCLELNPGYSKAKEHLEALEKVKT